MSAQENHLKAIADAIRKKEGTTAPIPANNFPARILAISTAPEGLCTIALSVGDEAGGTVFGGGLVEQGVTVTVKAVPEDGYEFTGWQENGQTVSADAEHTFTVAGNRELVGVFGAAVSRLPEGYTKTEYILFPDVLSQVSLSYYANQKNITRVVFDFTDVAINQGTIFYGFTPYPENAPIAILFNQNTINYAPTSAGTWGETNYSIEVDKRMIVNFDFKNKTIAIDGQTLQIEDARPVVTLSSLDIGANGVISASAKMKLYSFKMYNETDLVIDFVPCINESGTAGLYDLVGNAFFSGRKVSSI